MLMHFHAGPSSSVLLVILPQLYMSPLFSSAEQFTGLFFISTKEKPERAFLNFVEMGGLEPPCKKEAFKRLHI
ncbi:MAG: hypothetical protein ACJAV6_000087 [Candidatus Paceibacteria bacterium]|jgi:hypothetical protein